MAATTNPEEVVEKVFSLYDKHGNEDYIGEPVSQLEHMSQAAALAEAEGYEDEVVLAAFFHDIGHLCAGFGLFTIARVFAETCRPGGMPRDCQKVPDLQASRILQPAFRSKQSYPWLPGRPDECGGGSDF
jgi:hypothetical protein